MYKNFAFVFFVVTLITISSTEARGGRGGGGGRSGGRGSIRSRGSFSRSGSSSFSGSHTGQHSSGGWFHGFFHTPYHFTYIPRHTNRIGTSSYNEQKEEESTQGKDTSSYAVGYAISRSLSSDFFAIFNMVHDISKIPEKVKSKEFVPSTTTVGPVSTYNINHIIDDPYARLNKIFDLDSKSNDPNEEVLVDVANSNSENQ